eukprot:CAMPEP_0176044732 /NCGR_PEP_ID=MMETSP0120_2-20121206/22202_1 /TAXON_ID=160619 /ORGANISM="Kryptoperidinium foliaceum, Strain CCMP 1326" /LENGTH=677 /DNA_ID=CAMNT_0017378137 /DNA_START=54 /DNA_END=2085 /DNA_ORIENTATION=+
MVAASAPAKRRAGVLCFRRGASMGGGGDKESGYEFLLVSRRRKSRGDDIVKERALDLDNSYTVPAGKFEEDSDRSCEDCALREAHEEAGVECRIVRDIGWRESSSKYNQPARTRYFLASLVRCHDSWLEDGERERVWVSPATALEKVSYREDLCSVVRAGARALAKAFADEALSNPCLAAAPQIAVPRRGGCQGVLTRVSSITSCGTDASVPELDEERYLCYSNQVGGHFCMLKPAPGTRVEVELAAHGQEKGFLCGRRGSRDLTHVQGARVVLKPLNTQEERFYFQKLSDPALAGLHPLTPLCYGTKRLRPEQIEFANDAKDGVSTSAGRMGVRFGTDSPQARASQDPQRYLVLEDVGQGAAMPCLLDLKVGCKQRAAKHGEKKRKGMAAKAARSTSAALGFRICGMQSYSAETGELHRRDKYWGQQVTQEDMLGALGSFFGQRRRLIEAVLERLERLDEVVRRLPGLRFWGCSLLVLFDAAGVAEGQGEVPVDLSKAVHVRMIDFANFEDVGGDLPDEEYLCGLANIQAYLRALLDGSGAAGVEHRLVPPPKPELQDAEQERAWRALQRPASDGAEPVNADDIGVANLEANALTISGAVGRALSRELGALAFFRPDEEVTRDSSRLDDLFQMEHMSLQQSPDFPEGQGSSSANGRRLRRCAPRTRSASPNADAHA